jgi:glucans biosynthesis protein
LVNTRHLVLVLAAAVAVPAIAETPATQPFSEAWLQTHAQQLASAPYDSHEGALPKELAELGYDQLRDIRFRADHAVFGPSGSPFQLQLFHLGHIFKQPVALYVVERGQAKRIDYDPSMFDFGKNQFPEPLGKELGFAGFRAHFPVNRPGVRDEVISFLGASYFRAVGSGNAYGLSARGLAIDTAMPKGEEFPWFREFYVEKPGSRARTLVVHAILDSPTTAGAYRFDITPGEKTVVRVTATLYPRKGAERLGLAPLTSMFFFGDNGAGRFDDFRQAVHDSDGLLLWLGNGERVWRPLRNPERLQVSAFQAPGLQGFGLLQRHRLPRDYSDAESVFERRPSAWVEPLEGFGDGTVYLVEIPSQQETDDNVVAFFTPGQGLTPGTPLRFAYRLLWGRDPEPPVPVASAASTRIGNARTLGVPEDKQTLPRSARRFVIDFVPASPPESVEGMEAVVTVSSGAVHGARVVAYPAIGAYRAVFDFVPEAGKPVDMRCYLRRGSSGDALTETWTYSMPPPPEEKRS